MRRWIAYIRFFDSEMWHVSGSRAGVESDVIHTAYETGIDDFIDTEPMLGRALPLQKTF